MAERVQLPPGVHLAWAGQFQYLERAQATFMIIAPFTLLLVFVLIYLNTGSGDEDPHRVYGGALLAGRRGVAPLS